MNEAAGAAGAKGDTGAPGTARAYAYMDSPGTDPCDLLAAETKNFTACSRPSTGVYCLSPAAGIDPNSSPAFVTVEWGSSGGNSLAVFVEDTNQFGSTDDCGTTRYEVQTYDFTGAASDNVAFNILVP